MSAWYWAMDGMSPDDRSIPTEALPPGIAPEDGLRGGQHHYGLKPPAYSLPLEVWNPRRVSCSACDWHLEDEDWCCDHDCNVAGPHYRQAYVCKDPSDETGKLTSRCEDQECTADGLPLLCTAARLAERQLEDTRKDEACVKRKQTKPALFFQ